MHRRNLLRMATAALLPGGISVAALNEHTQFVSPTRYIDSNHPQIKSAVANVAPSTLGARARAVRIHDFVRDQVKFGWTSDFYDQSASEVLKSGVGFCNTKGTLFAAMLRAADVPARQHFVDINAQILSPFIDPGTPYVDHSFVEVWLDDCWWATDSYIVDLPLYTAAQRQLRERGQVLGFGVHRDGASRWDAQSNSYCQFVRSPDFPALTTRDHGIYQDVGAFYASGNGVNRLNVLLKLGFGIFARAANSRIEALRGAA